MGSSIGYWASSSAPRISWPNLSSWPSSKRASQRSYVHRAAQARTGFLNSRWRNMAWLESKHRFRPGAPSGWAAARLELEHQAEHWDTPDHGDTGHLIAQALRSAIDIAQSGGLHCEHRVD